MSLTLQLTKQNFLAMSFTKEHVGYGLLKLDGPRKIRVHKTTTQYDIINLSEDATDARWGGDAVNVYMKNGKVRRYTSLSQFTTV